MISYYLNILTRIDQEDIHNLPCIKHIINIILLALNSNKGFRGSIQSYYLYSPADIHNQYVLLVLAKEFTNCYITYIFNRLKICGLSKQDITINIVSLLKTLLTSNKNRYSEQLCNELTNFAITSGIYGGSKTQGMNHYV